MIAFIRFFKSLLISAKTFLEYNLRSRAHWSFLDLAVWSFLPTLPTLFVSSFSTKEWMSSSFKSISSFLDFISSKIFFSSLAIISKSSWPIIPFLLNISTWASEPVMSSSNKILSKSIDLLNSWVNSSSPSKWDPHKYILNSFIDLGFN